MLTDDMRPTVERRLGERVNALGLESFGQYHRYLRYHPSREAETEMAVELVTTRETYFFREQAQLSAFRNEVLPEIRESAAARRSLTVWSAGCSTGEEVYTLAMLIAQTAWFSGWEVRVFGNDISRRALQAARRAVYRPSSFRAMPEEYQKFFVDTAGGREVVPAIRALGHFGHFNLLDEARSAMVGLVDAVFCRNVLIYFDRESRRRLIEIFYRRLRPGGFLMLGHSESLLNVSTAFELAHLSGDLVYRKPRQALHPSQEERSG
jgi:chemotaxis protein methyltransferase CheR